MDADQSFRLEDPAESPFLSYERRATEFKLYA
jgi:hypothetical protein